MKLWTLDIYIVTYEWNQQQDSQQGKDNTQLVSLSQEWKQLHQFFCSKRPVSVSLFPLWLCFLISKFYLGTNISSVIYTYNHLSRTLRLNKIKTRKICGRQKKALMDNWSVPVFTFFTSFFPSNLIN